MKRFRILAPWLCATILLGIAGCPFPVDDMTSVGDTASQRGRVLYQARRCVNCHGADGLGISVFPGGPRVVGRSAADLRTALVTSCEDAVDLNQCHPLIMSDLTDGQLTDLATYLQDLAGASHSDPGPVCDDVPGNICTIAGNGVPGHQARTDLLAREQTLFWPQNINLDPQGRVVITDWNNYMFKRIDPTQCATITDSAGREGTDCRVSPIVGTGLLGDSCSTEGNPIAANRAMMNHTVGLFYDDSVPGQQNMLLWGWHQWKIKYIPIDPDGTIGNIYCLWGNNRGTGPDDVAAGYNFDGNYGPTLLNLPSACVRDNRGNYYISDQGNLRIRTVLADEDDDNSSSEAFVQSRQNNIITNFAGGRRDEFGNFIRTLSDYSDSGDGGPASECTFNVSTGFDAVPQMRIDYDRDRNLLYVADSENHRIRVIDLNVDPPIIDTFAGGGDDLAGAGVGAFDVKLNRPADVDVVPGGDGDILITDTFNHCVRLVDYETRTVTTLAGICGPDETGYEGDGGPATAAKLYEPGGSYLAQDGTLYIADTINHRVRRVNPTR